MAGTPIPRKDSVTDRILTDVQRYNAKLESGSREILGVGANVYRALDSIYKIATLATMVYLIEYTAVGSFTALAFAALLITGAEGLERLLIAIADENSKIVVERREKPPSDD